MLLKNAGATAVSVILRGDQGRASPQVTDDARDPLELPQADRFSGMAERAELFGG